MNVMMIDTSSGLWTSCIKTLQTFNGNQFKHIEDVLIIDPIKLFKAVKENILKKYNRIIN